jgi:hypothetical protein
MLTTMVGQRLAPKLIALKTSVILCGVQVRRLT